MAIRYGTLSAAYQTPKLPTHNLPLYLGVFLPPLRAATSFHLGAGHIRLRHIVWPWLSLWLNGSPLHCHTVSVLENLPWRDWGYGLQRHKLRLFHALFLKVLICLEGSVFSSTKTESSSAAWGLSLTQSFLSPLCHSLGWTWGTALPQRLCFWRPLSYSSSWRLGRRPTGCTTDPLSKPSNPSLTWPNRNSRNLSKRSALQLWSCFPSSCKSPSLTSGSLTW